MTLFPAGVNVDEINRKWLPKLDQSLGVRVISCGNDRLLAELDITEALLQPFGVMHGGVSCVLGESLGSIAGGMTLRDPGQTVVGQSLYALHLRPVKVGMTLEAEAIAEHIGRRSQIWTIQLRDKATQKPTAKVTLTLAVIDLPKA
ncbi:MAG: PaaI family thioesterase [Bdellovibrionota bacterium]|nr:MAG: PaaI family thioesterase [Pseudomonadota bacterium]